MGRPRLARLSRWVWLQVRLDGVNDPVTNGEYHLLSKVCRDVSIRGSGAFVDVGANVGDWTSFLIGASVSDDNLGDLQVHAFEPSPASFLKLRDRVTGLLAEPSAKGISAHLNELAVGRSVAEADLSLVSATGGTNTLVPFDDAPRATASISVPVTTLEVYAEKAGLEEIDFVKIDTEGNDFAVLEGAAGLLDAQRIRWIQFEYNHRWISSRAYLRDVFLLADRYGYNVGKVTPRGVEIYSRWHPELESFREGNYLLWYDALPSGVATVPWWSQ